MRATGVSGSWTLVFQTNLHFPEEGYHNCDCANVYITIRVQWCSCGFEQISMQFLQICKTGQHTDNDKHTDYDNTRYISNTQHWNIIIDLRYCILSMLKCNGNRLQKHLPSSIFAMWSKQNAKKQAECECYCFDGLATASGNGYGVAALGDQCHSSVALDWVTRLKCCGEPLWLDTLWWNDGTTRPRAHHQHSATPLVASKWNLWNRAVLARAA